MSTQEYQKSNGEAIKGLIETLKEGNDRDRDTLLEARQQNEEDLKNELAWLWIVEQQKTHMSY
jgi:hypothetical protein